MSSPKNTESPRREPADYFSRRIDRHAPWTEDLVTIDSDGEPHDNGARDSAPLSPVLQDDLLTPATLSPPVETTETSPLLGPRSQTYQYASTAAPVVCCRAGGRPADIPPPNANAHVFPSGPPQNMGGYQRRSRSDLESNRITRPRRYRQKSKWCGSKYLHRWVLALSFLVILVLLQRLLCVNSTDTSTVGDSHCSLRYCTETFTHAFDEVETFTFVDELGDESPVQGAVWIEPAQEGQEADIVATVSYGASTRFKVSTPNWKTTDSSIHLQLPTISRSSDVPSRIFRSRLTVSVTLRLKPAIDLTSLNITTTHLAITASPYLFDPKTPTLQPKINTTTLLTHSTPVHLPHWASRHTIIHTSSAPIIGSFTLLDLLSLDTQSGAITIGLSSGPSDPSDRQPAQLSIATSSGSVRVDTSTTTVHDREYKTTVTSQSGSVKGTYLLGTEALFTTQSGSITAEFCPHEAGSLQTRSSSGSTYVRVLSGTGVEGLRASHESSGSGSLNLRYPGEWEGVLEAGGSSGKVSVEGRGIVIDSDGGRGGWVLAHKGDGDGRIKAWSGSGGIDVLVGK